MCLIYISVFLVFIIKCVDGLCYSHVAPRVFSSSFLGTRCSLLSVRPPVSMSISHSYIRPVSQLRSHSVSQTCIESASPIFSSFCVLKLSIMISYPIILFTFVCSSVTPSHFLGCPQIHLQKPSILSSFLCFIHPSL